MQDVYTISKKNLLKALSDGQPVTVIINGEYYDVEPENEPGADLTAVIDHYRMIEYSYRKSLEKHPDAAGNEYITGYITAIKHILGDLNFSTLQSIQEATRKC